MFHIFCEKVYLIWRKLAKKILKLLQKLSNFFLNNDIKCVLWKTIDKNVESKISNFDTFLQTISVKSDLILNFCSKCWSLLLWLKLHNYKLYVYGGWYISAVLFYYFSTIYNNFSYGLVHFPTQFSLPIVIREWN